MSINLTTRYPGKVAPASTNYPYGSARNVTTSNDGTGTPWEEAIVNDIVGFQQALLVAADITPSETPDNAVNSQYLQSLYTLFPTVYPSIEEIPDSISNLPNGRVVLVSGYRSSTLDGGGVFVVGNYIHDGVVNFDRNRVGQIGTAAYYVRGATATKCLRRINTPVLTPLMAGARGNGSDDDAIPLQGLMNYLEDEVGGQVYINRSYLTGSTISVPSHVTFNGSSWHDASIAPHPDLPDNAELIINHDSPIGANSFGTGNVTFINISFGGSSETSRTAPIITISKASNIRFEGCRFLQNYAGGVAETGNSNVSFNDCTFRVLGNMSSGLPALASLQSDADGQLSINTRIRGCTFVNNGRQGVLLSGIGTILTNCSFTVHVGHVVQLQDTALRHRIVDNYITANTVGSGMFIRGSSHVIANNNISSVAAAGIVIDDTPNTLVTDNIIGPYRTDNSISSIISGGIMINNLGAMANTIVQGNTVTRNANGVHAIIVRTTGTNAAPSNLQIINNNLAGGATGTVIRYFANTDGQIFGENCTVKGNAGHESSSGEVRSFQAGASAGSYSISNLTFPPNKLRFRAVHDSGTGEVRTSEGTAFAGGTSACTYNTMAPANDFVSTATVSNAVISMINSSGATIFNATITNFTGGSGTGFTINKTVATINPTIIVEALP